MSNASSVWQSVGIDEAFLESSAIWLSDERSLHGKVLRHFEVAGSLVRFSRQDYKLGSVAFFHAVIGLERALKLHYHAEDAKLQELLNRALEEKVITDALFENPPAFTEFFANMVDRRIKPRPASHAELLVQLVPALRNEYMHGDYLLAPDFLHLTLQVRTIVDRLTVQP